MPVQFPFGFGLSYTTFEYSNPQVSASSFRDVDGVTVSVDVTNTGAVAGKEIVQLYVLDKVAGLVRPDKELKGFAKVELAPGETKTVSIELDFRAFAFYHPEYGQWITEDGEFDLLIAASATDVRQTVTVTLESTLTLPCILDKESTIREWLADPRGQVVAGPVFAQMQGLARRMFGGGGEEEGEGRYNTDSAIGMDIMEMFKDMPLVSVLLFMQAAFDRHPEDIVADFLQQVHDTA